MVAKGIVGGRATAWIRLVACSAFLVVVDVVSAQEGGGGDGGICWMQYSMADNDLHTFLVTDINEMSQSELIRDPSVTNWIYVDGSPRAESFDRIEGLVNEDGSKVEPIYQGVRYISWDHAKEAMVLKQELGELNSDDPQSLQNFLQVALADCVAKGKSQYMLILSSHGSGFGFGGDEVHLRRRRRLEQSNEGISSAIQGALQSVDGAPDRLDLLAFDACLQASLESLRDFQNSTRYYLASEATEPGTGYPYDKLSAQSNVVDIATETIDLFVATPQSKKFIFFGKGVHQPPKTLALFDLDKIDPFYEAWEALSAEMTTIMAAHNDTQFYSLLTKSRANTATFAGAMDVPTGEPNEVTGTMDIGNFLDVFSNSCNPDPDHPITNLLLQAQTAYNEMILQFQKGPATPQPATGMSVTWVSRRMYLMAPKVYEFLLFNESQHYFQKEAPLYSEFLYQFVNYDETKDTPSNDTGICGCPKVFPKDGQLMWDRSVEESSDKKDILIKAQIADTVDSLLVEFGIDVTPLILGEEEEGEDPASRRRQLVRSKLGSWQEKLRKNFHPTKERIAPSHRHLNYPSAGTAGGLNTKRKAPHVQSRTSGRRRRHGRRHRRAQEAEDVITEEDPGEDYFLIFGGLVSPLFDCDGFDANWDKDFYVLMNSTDGEVEDFIYVYRGSLGESSVPVIYFPSSTSDAMKADVQTKMENFDLTIEEAESMGGQWGNLEFDSNTFQELPEGQDALPLDVVALYTPSATGLLLAETPTSQGGFILPILYVESQLDGFAVNYLIGGFYNRIIDWKENITLGVAPVPVRNTTKELGVNTTVIDLYAEDLVAEGAEPIVQFNYYLLTHGEDGEIVQIESSDDSGSNKAHASLTMVGVITMVSWVFIAHS